MLNREQPQKNKQHLSPVFIYLLEKRKKKKEMPVSAFPAGGGG